MKCANMWSVKVLEWKTINNIKQVAGVVHSVVSETEQARRMRKPSSRIVVCFFDAGWKECCCGVAGLRYCRGLFHKGIATCRIANCRGLFHKTLSNCKLQLAISLVVSMETRAKSLAAANPLVRFHGNDQWDWNCKLQLQVLHEIGPRTRALVVTMETHSNGQCARSAICNSASCNSFMK
jgi:hypothetical protein